MTLLVLGLSHRTAPVDLLDAAAVPAELHAKALASVTQREHVLEAVVVSTCNRVEVYANVTRYHGGVADLRDHFAEWAGVSNADIAHRLYDRFDLAAAEHLFAVASGLDSMVVGERQIHGQIRQSFATAMDEGAVGTVLHRVFGQAIKVGRRTRAETSISEGAASIVDVAMTAADEALTTPTPHVLLIGAGKIGGMVGGRVAERSAGIRIANRTLAKAEDLAVRIGGSAADLDAIAVELETADLVVTSTDAVRPLIDADMVRAAMAQRDGRPLVMVDLAVPRDIDPQVRQVPGVTVIDIDALRRVVTEGPTGAAVAEARAIVADEASAFIEWTRGVQAGPTIAALRGRAEGVRTDELDRFSSKLSTLDDDQRAAVEALTRGIVNTLLHTPTVRLKGLVDTPDGERYVRALTHLFDIQPDGGGAPVDADGDQMPSADTIIRDGSS